MSSAFSNPFMILLVVAVMAAAVTTYIAYLFDRVFIKKRISKIDLIVFLFIFILPAYTSINANISFNQSILQGVLSTWGKQVSIILVLLYQFFIRAKRVNIRKVYYVVIGLAWITMLSKFYLTLTLNPALLVETDLVGYNPAKGGYVFRFDATVEQIAVVFYFTSFIITKKWYHLLGFGAFMGYMLFVDKGRIDIVSLFIVMGFVMIRNLSPIKFAKMSLVLGSLGAIGIIIGYQIAPDEIIVLRNMLLNFALTVAGIDSGENSASSRFIQFGVVFNHFLKHPEQMIFGVGILERDTMHIQFGHLYLSDIGIVGLFFTFGIVGISILYGLFIYALRLTWKVKFYKRDLFYKLTESIMVMLLITSFFNGSFVWAPGTFLTFLLFLHTYTLMEKEHKIQQRKRFMDQNLSTT